VSPSPRSLLTALQAQPFGPRSAHAVARYALAAVAVGAVVLLLVIGYESFRTNSSSEVVYSVTGDSVASEITYRTSDGPLHESSVGLPWQTTVATGAVASVVAQGDGRSHSISCIITSANGTLLATQTAVGPFAVVKCTRSRTKP
jgi:Mycobacterium membrane protein